MKINSPSKKSSKTMRISQLCLFLISWLGFIYSLRLWSVRANLPYNEAGRFFKDGIVYHEQGVFVYAVLSVLLFLSSFIIGAWMWRSHRKTEL